MDKRIVIWSGYNQRVVQSPLPYQGLVSMIKITLLLLQVKGILEGHKRGVRCVFASNELLISGSFDCEGRIWNLTTRECKAILSGHRVSIVAARLMFEGANSEEDVRAFTVVCTLSMLHYMQYMS